MAIIWQSQCQWHWVNVSRKFITTVSITTLKQSTAYPWACLAVNTVYEQQPTNDFICIVPFQKIKIFSQYCISSRHWLDWNSFWFNWKMVNHKMVSKTAQLLQPRYQSSWDQHGAHLGPVGPRWAPSWPHAPCYQGRLILAMHLASERRVTLPA